MIWNLRISGDLQAREASQKCTPSQQGQHVHDLGANLNTGQLHLGCSLHCRPCSTPPSVRATTRTQRSAHRSMAAGATGSLAESALAFVASSVHIELSTRLQLRATTRFLWSVITGHMPAARAYRAFIKPTRDQARWLLHSSALSFGCVAQHLVTGRLRL